MAKKSNGQFLGFFCVSHKVVAEDDFKKLKPTSKLLYFHLCKIRNDTWRKIRNNSDQRFYHNDVVLAKEMGLSRWTFIRARKELTGNPDDEGNPTTTQYIDFWTVGNTSWYRVLDDVYAKLHEQYADKDGIKGWALESAKWTTDDDLPL